MTQELLLNTLDDRYARFRIVQPAAERAVLDSMRRLGQLMPIVACERPPVFAVVDGFKRVAAARALGIEALRARVMPLGEAAALAALITFNRRGRGMSDFEEALVVKALCRDEGLLQVQVAELLGRNKSWVCRRLSLVERLAEAVADDLRAGLLSTTIAREIARLPRGNQADVATSILRHKLTSHEVALLVTCLEKARDATQQRHVLDNPRATLEAHNPNRVIPESDPRLGPEAQALARRLQAALRALSDLCARLSSLRLARLRTAERQALLPMLTKTHGAAGLLSDHIKEIVNAMKEERDVV